MYQSNVFGIRSPFGGFSISHLTRNIDISISAFSDLIKASQTKQYNKDSHHESRSLVLSLLSFLPYCPSFPSINPSPTANHLLLHASTIYLNILTKCIPSFHHPLTQQSRESRNQVPNAPYTYKSCSNSLLLKLQSDNLSRLYFLHKSCCFLYIFSVVLYSSDSRSRLWHGGFWGGMFCYCI